MDSDLGKNNYPDYEREIQEVKTQLEWFEHNFRPIGTPEEAESVEREIGRLVDKLHGLLFGLGLQRSLDTEEFSGEEKKLVKSLPLRFKGDGKEPVTVRTSRGSSIVLAVRYYRQKVFGRRKSKRYSGLYPGLLMLGIHDRCTPELASCVSMLCALLSSCEEARNVLMDRGIELDIKSVRAIAYRYAARARATQQASSFSLQENVAGRRVVIAADGGRIRIRQKKRGPKTRKGRNHFHTCWREPKLLIVYVVDAEGKLEQSFSPFIDGTLGGPDALFLLLEYYLGQLRIKEADQVLFVSDGARWLWNRYPTLAKALGLETGQVYELIDFYHAVEHLGAVAALRKEWSAKERGKWVKRHRRLLLKGCVDQVIEAVRTLCRGRNSKKVRTQRDYFVRNRDRMLYHKIKEMKLPLGSGAIESAIRRVVNLRLKGASTFWCKENAEAILILRSYYKAGRWNTLKNMANSFLRLQEA